MKCRSQLRADQLLVAGSLESQVDNLWFLPIEPFNEAHHILTLSIDVFPAVKFRLTSSDDDLIPLDRDLLRNSVGCSYWDVTLSPGKVWSEPGDDGWSRAALPFQLTNTLENDTHHGIAVFLYNDTEGKNLSETRNLSMGWWSTRR